MTQKIYRIFLMIVCLALWNVLLVSCDDGDGDGDDGGIFMTHKNQQILEPQAVEWTGAQQVRVMWIADVSAQSYLVYDKTEEGPMIRAAVDAKDNSSVVELTIDNVDPAISHEFKILAE